MTFFLSGIRSECTFCALSVTVMRRSRSRVDGGGLVLLPHLIERLLPQLQHRHVMYMDPATSHLRGGHRQNNTTE
jgi:hypothetical protein